MLAENKGGISIIFVTIVKRLFNLDNCLARAKFVLEISKKIYDILKSKGVDTYLLRSGDNTISYDDRIKNLKSKLIITLKMYFNECIYIYIIFFFFFFFTSSRYYY